MFPTKHKFLYIQTHSRTLNCGTQNKTQTVHADVLGKTEKHCSSFSPHITLNLISICDLVQGFNLSFLR